MLVTHVWLPPRAKALTMKSTGFNGVRAIVAVSATPNWPKLDRGGISDTQLAKIIISRAPQRAVGCGEARVGTGIVVGAEAAHGQSERGGGNGWMRGDDRSWPSVSR